MTFNVASMPDQTTPALLMSPMAVSLDGGPDNDTILVNYNNVLLGADQAVNENGGPGNDTIGLSMVNASPSSLPRSSGTGTCNLVGGLGDDFVFANIYDPYGQQGFVYVQAIGGPGTNDMEVDYTGKLDGFLKLLLVGGNGDDLIKVNCNIDAFSTGGFQGAIWGGGGNDNLIFDVFFVLPNGNKIGLGKGKLASFFALLDGQGGFDTCQATANVIVQNCEA
jgi:hypothetical protein